MMCFLPGLSVLLTDPAFCSEEERIMENLGAADVIVNDKIPVVYYKLIVFSAGCQCSQCCTGYYIRL